MARINRTACAVLVAFALLVVSVACGGDDDDSSAGNDPTQATTSATGQATSTSDDEGDAEPTEGESGDDDDGGTSGDDENVHAELSIGSSGVVESHDPGPTADFDADILSPLQVTIVDIIDPAPANSVIFQPAAGNRYWAAEVLLESPGDKIVNTGEPWLVTTTDGTEYEVTFLTEVGEDIMYGPLEAGESEQGFVVFEIPEGAEVASLSVNASIYVGGTLVFDAP